MPKEGLEAEPAGEDQPKTGAIVCDEKGATGYYPAPKCAIVRAETKPPDETSASQGHLEPLADAAVLLSLAEAIEDILAAGSVDLARIALAQLRGLLLGFAEGHSTDIVELLPSRRGSQ